MDMANLKPDVLFVEWTRRIRDDVLETLPKGSVQKQTAVIPYVTHLQALLKLLLLLVYYSKPEIYFIRFFEVGLHSHDLAESLFGVLKRTISIIKYTDSIPQFWLLSQC